MDVAGRRLDLKDVDAVQDAYEGAVALRLFHCEQFVGALTGREPWPLAMLPREEVGTGLELAVVDQDRAPSGSIG